MTQQLPSVVLDKTIDASARVVFEAWLDRAALTRFMCPAPGSSVTHVESDPKVGGRFLIMMHVGGRDRPHRGEYLEIDRHSRLVFTWSSEAAGEGSRVVLTFTALSSEQTRLRLEHFALPPENRAAHHAGWSHILQLLSAL